MALALKASILGRLRWLDARRVFGREAADVKRILKEKLEQPHLRDLARSPMQLAILLSLIHTRGTSLPDKRTALYDSYVELFFSREAEKSPVVRDNRDLLVEIHGFLAWTLHKEAERGGNSGRVGAEHLKRLVADYLVAEGHDTRICEALFQGVIERVVALVSRVEGTYEFEVQPLREYFAARYLYATARYSPTGAECQGTLPDRFDALIKNFYWLNVARFYAGCFSKGELPSIVDRVQELIKDPQYALVSHPRTLAATLLSDWVFSQHKKSMRDMVAIVTDGIGLRSIMSAGTRRRGEQTFQLPIESGRQELIDRCFDVLAGNPGGDYAHEVVELMRANPTDDIPSKLKSRLEGTAGEERSRWLEWGLFLGLVQELDRDLLVELSTERGQLDSARVCTIFRARRFDCIESSPEMAAMTVDLILERRILRHRQQNNVSILETFASVFNADQYMAACASPLPMPLAQALRRRATFADAEEEKSLSVPPVGITGCHDVCDIAKAELEKECGEWRSTIGPWERVVEAGRTHFGERWAFFHFANIASGIRASTETCTDASEALDRARPLCRRARYARLRAGNSQWWLRQFDTVSDHSEAAFLVLMLLSWGSPQSIAECSERVDLTLGELPEAAWLALFESLKHLLRADDEYAKAGRGLELKGLPASLSPRAAVAFAFRMTRKAWRSVDSRYLVTDGGTDIPILAFKQTVALDIVANRRASRVSKDEALATIRQTYRAGVASFDKFFPRVWHVYHPDTLDQSAAKAIAVEADKYPTFLATAAEEVCTRSVLKTIQPVAAVADRDAWFVV